jgi:hypothetical protein
MAERYFAKKVKLEAATTYVEYLKDTLLIVQGDMTLTPIGIGSAPYIVISYFNDVPTLSDAGGTVSYEIGDAAPTYVEVDYTSDFVTVLDGDSSTGWVLTADNSAEDMNTVGTFPIIFTVVDAAGNTSDSLTITFTITADVTVPVITLTATTDNLAVADAPLWTPATNMISAIDNIDGDVSGSVVYTYQQDTSGGAAITDLAAARTYLATIANVVYVTYNVDDTAGNNAVEKTYTVTAIA